MSRYDDKWLDICLLLKELQTDGGVLITPSDNSGNLKSLRFKVMANHIFGETAEMLLEVLKLADRFEFFVSDSELEVSIFVNVFNT